MGIRLRYRIVDVFTAVPLAGNALCVVLDPCPEPVMAAIAREVNLSETTFPTVTGEDSYEMRIFTPSTELPFAGHPSLGTAFALGPGRWVQTTEGATVVVEADAEGAVMGQPLPSPRGVDPSEVEEALGLPGSEAAEVAEAAGIRHLVVATTAALEPLRPDPLAVRALSHRFGATTVAVMGLVDRSTLQARVFAPVVGIEEDPGTGAAAGPMAVLARRVWSTDRHVTILQGAEVGRPSRLEVDVDESELRVGGRVAACAEGHFTL